MSATILVFPGTAPASAARRRAGQFATTAPAVGLSAKFVDHFLPIVQASIDLLEADDVEFEARCRRMLDADGVTMIEDLCTEMQVVGRQMKLLVDGLELTRSRLRTAVARLADLRERQPGSLG